MRFLGVGTYNDLNSLYHRLHQAGHPVQVVVEDDASREALALPIESAGDLSVGLDWLRAGGDDGIVLFEGVGHGEVADHLRRDGFRVIGGSAFGDRLETDRAYGQKVLTDAGVNTARTWSFSDFEAGIGFVHAQPGRYVLKLSGTGYSPGHTFPGELADGRDMVAMLRWHQDRWRAEEPPDFVLMEHLDGVEVGVGAYFNGERFLLPACIDWEHKRFFPGDLGEMTGEMGTVVSYEGADRLFASTLERIAPLLRDAGHVGYVNINTIVNARGVFPLEFTCRFGYPGYAILEPLQAIGWDALFQRMLDRSSRTLPTRTGFCVGVVLTIPPFPYQTEYAQAARGLPILFRNDPDAEDRRNMHLGDVRRQGDVLVTSGDTGYVMVVTGVGPDVAAAKTAAYRRVANLVVPKLRYRVDIGDRLLHHDLAWLRAHGWLPRPE